MALADKLQELQKAQKRQLNICAYQAMYDSLTPENRKALDEAWSKGLSVNLILAALRSEGIKSSNESIRRHFKGLCACPKK